MDFYFGKEQTGNYIEEGKYKKISEKIYNNINRYEIVLDIINKRIFKNIMYLKETKTSFITFNILDSPYRTTYYNI